MLPSRFADQEERSIEVQCASALRSYILDQENLERLKKCWKGQCDRVLLYCKARKHTVPVPNFIEFRIVGNDSAKELDFAPLLTPTVWQSILQHLVRIISDPGFIDRAEAGGRDRGQRQGYANTI